MASVAGFFVYMIVLSSVTFSGSDVLNAMGESSLDLTIVAGLFWVLWVPISYFNGAL